MDPRRIASISAVVGGVGWLAKVALIWANGGEDAGTGVVGVMNIVGIAGLIIALAAAGYTLVEKAPAWLRAVVAIATPLLVLMIWALVDQAIQAMYTEEGWLREELSVVLAGAVAVIMGVWGRTRHREHAPGSHAADPPAAPPARGRRAAR